MPTDTFNQLQPEKRERITAAAVEVFSQAGFNGADVAEIARRAGVAKGSIYNYFSNKEDLYVFVCRDGLDRSRQTVYGAIDPEWDIYRQIEHIFRQGKTFVLEHPDYLRLYINISSAGMESFAEQLTMEVEKHTADHLKKLLHDGISQGLVRSDIDVDMAAFTINGLYIVFMFSLVSRHFSIRMEEYLGEGSHSDGNDINDRLTQMLAMIHTMLKPVKV